MNAQMTNAGGIASLPQADQAPAQAMQGTGGPMAGPQQPQQQGGAQKAQLTPELLKLMFLNQMKEASQKQAAIQQQVPGGTILEQLQASFAPQAAPMPAQQPVRAAHGGLMQLPSHLGKHYAGGGIIAFDDGGDVPTDIEADVASRAKKRRGFDFERDIPFSGDDVQQTPRPQVDPSELLAQLHAKLLASPTAEGVRKHQVGNAGVTPKSAAQQRDDGTGAGKVRASASSSTAANTGIAAAPELSPFAKLLYGDVEKQLGRNSDAEGDTAFKKHLQRSGIEQAVAEAREDAKQKAALYQQQRSASEYNPLWSALSRFGAAAPSTGLAGAASAGADSFVKSGEAQRAADAANLADQLKMRADVRNTVLGGNKDAAGAAEKRQDFVERAQGTARQTGASLENAHEAMLGRVQAAQIAAEGHRIARAGLEQNRLQALDQKQQTAIFNAINQATQREAAVYEAAMKNPDVQMDPVARQAAETKYRNNVAEASRQIYAQFGVKQIAAAGNPTGGGNVRLKFDAKGNPIN